jgi:hypothetical protein
MKFVNGYTIEFVNGDGREDKATFEAVGPIEALGAFRAAGFDGCEIVAISAA